MGAWHDREPRTSCEPPQRHRAGHRAHRETLMPDRHQRGAINRLTGAGFRERLTGMILIPHLIAYNYMHPRGEPALDPLWEMCRTSAGAVAELDRGSGQLIR